MWRVSDCEEFSGGYSQEMMGIVLVVPKQDLKLPVRSSETAVPLEGPIGMLTGCRIVSQSDIRVRIAVMIPCHHRLGSGQVMDLHTSVFTPPTSSIVKVVHGTISTYTAIGGC